MGNSNTLNKIQDLPINFKQIKRQQHNILGSIRYIQNNHQGKSYILIQKAFASQFDCQKYIKKIKSRQKMGKMQKKYYPNQFIMEILDYRKQQFSQVCGKTYKVFLFLKDFQKDLKKLFNEKVKIGQYIPQEQLLYLILRIVNCLIQLYDHQIQPFQISLQSIICYNSNKYKIIDSQLSNCMRPIDQLLYKSQLNKGIYLAPQTLSNISNKSSQTSITTSKSDIFALGMVILSLTALKQLDSFYDYVSMKISFRELQLLILKLNYSSFLKQILREMLSRNEHQRIGLLRLKEKLKQHKINQIQLLNNHQNNNNNSLKDQQSGHLIYLGNNYKTKRSFTKDSLNVNNSLSTNTYHPLYNKKKQSISKKSLSFIYPSQTISVKNSQRIVPKYDRIQFDSRQSNLSKKSYNFNMLPPKTYKANSSFQKSDGYYQVVDLSEIRSDVPVSPITYQQKVLNQQFNLINNNNNNNFVKNKQYKQQPQRFKSNSFRPYQQNQQKINIYDKVTKNNNKINQNNYKHNQPDFEELDIKSNINNIKDNQINIKNYDFIPKYKILQTPKNNIKQYNQKNQQKQQQNKSQSFYIKQSRSNITKKQLISVSLQQTPVKQMQLLQTKRKKSPRQQNNQQIKQRTYGRYDFSNGAVYQGEFNQQSQFEGNGILYYPSGKIFYSGNWYKNMFHGYGILNNVPNSQSDSPVQSINYKNFNLNQNSYWTQYEGQFSHDKKNGFGTLYFINGDKFSGCFLNDYIQGFGSFYSKNQSKPISGVWNNNIFQQ